jgi:nucleotide-binding universal stress UspA family protein
MAILPVTPTGMDGSSDYSFIAQEYVEKELQRWAHLPVLKGVKTHWVASAGAPALSILDIANDQHADLIVMGTHGRRGLPHLLMASVTEEVVRKAKCPVLSIGPGLHQRFDVNPRIHRILFPTDLTEHSMHALPLVASVGVEEEASVDCVHVMPRRSSGSLPLTEDIEHMQTKMRSLLCRHLNPRFHSNCLIDFGDVAERIVANAIIHESDLIVLGVGTRGFIDRHYEHITYRVIAEAPCPVLTWMRD